MKKDKREAESLPRTANKYALMIPQGTLKFPRQIRSCGVSPLLPKSERAEAKKRGQDEDQFPFFFSKKNRISKKGELDK